jgi:ClpX C4-type zinc finger
MVSQRPRDFYDTASGAWQTAMDQRKFEEAIKAGIDAYLHYHTEGNQKLSRAALDLIYLATSRLIFGDQPTPSSELCCSFCGRSGVDVRLGAGPDAFICADCVGIFYAELVTNQGGSTEPRRND